MQMATKACGVIGGIDRGSHDFQDLVFRGINYWWPIDHALQHPTGCSFAVEVQTHKKHSSSL